MRNWRYPCWKHSVPVTQKSALNSFKRDRYTEPAEHSPNGCRWWTTITPGNALAMAGFGKPSTRKTADRLVTEMLDRARAYNADPAKPGYLQRLRVFGSYLDRAVDPLGDVDVELVLGRRLNDPKEVLRYASASGRLFPTYIDTILWPQTEAVQILRNRSTAMSITTENVE
jgi:hypothetical protein